VELQAKFEPTTGKLIVPQSYPCNDFTPEELVIAATEKPKAKMSQR
jgi:hypothetical protein